MRNISDDQDIVYVSVLLETACHKCHRVVHYHGRTFLCNEVKIHPSCKSLMPDFSLQVYNIIIYCAVSFLCNTRIFIVFLCRSMYVMRQSQQITLLFSGNVTNFYGVGAARAECLQEASPGINRWSVMRGQHPKMSRLMMMFRLPLSLNLLGCSVKVRTV